MGFLLNVMIRYVWGAGRYRMSIPVTRLVSAKNGEMGAYFCACKARKGES